MHLYNIVAFFLITHIGKKAEELLYMQRKICRITNSVHSVEDNISLVNVEFEFQLRQSDSKNTCLSNTLSCYKYVTFLDAT